MSYSKAGVNLKKIKSLQSDVGRIIAPTFILNKKTEVISGFGHYAGLIRVGSYLLALHTDGVGTKIMIADLVGKYDTIGIDCIAMNVNDVICVGAEPIGFLDYIALASPTKNLVEQLMKGLVEGAKQSEMPIVGGETAIVPDLLAPGKNYSFDLVGSVLGIVKKRSVITGTSIKAGDVIVGLESNGLHSNGYTMVRKVLLSKYTINDQPHLMKNSLGKELLRPTRIYVKPIMEIIKSLDKDVHGLAHITGGSFTKLRRLNTHVNFYLNALPCPADIFRQIQYEGNINDTEMYSTFNMGIGFCIILPHQYVETVTRICKKSGINAFEIGIVTKGEGHVSIAVNDKNLIL